MFACSVTVSPLKPFADAIMQALLKLFEAVPGGVLGQVLAVDEHHTPLDPHVKPPGDDFTAARTAASAALSAAACAVSLRK
ncbi:MAG TPA: hypothetical protein VMU80_18265 [Bryobacteraceae bacterium]|nr:hypothetical protein [Bryobacteraceae bacterium]